MNRYFLNCLAWPALNRLTDLQLKLGSENFKPGTELRLKFPVGVHNLSSVARLKISRPNMLGVC